MDDGYKSKNGFYLCTESFTLEENHKLSKILKNKFNLNCGIHKHTNGHRLYIFSTSKDNLQQLIQPYLISHFYYKFDLTLKNKYYIFILPFFTIKFNICFIFAKKYLYCYFFFIFLN